MFSQREILEEFSDAQCAFNPELDAYECSLRVRDPVASEIRYRSKHPFLGANRWRLIRADPERHRRTLNTMRLWRSRNKDRVRRHRSATWARIKADPKRMEHHRKVAREYERRNRAKAVKRWQTIRADPALHQKKLEADRRWRAKKKSGSKSA